MSDNKPIIKRGDLPPNLTSSGRDRRTTQVDATEINSLRQTGVLPPVGQSRETQDQMILEGAKTSYVVVGPNGKGSFGVVFQAVEKDTQNVVAIKRVLQDPRYKNRELQIMKMLDHINCVQLLDSFCERSKGEVYLNLVLAFIPKNLYEVCNSFQKAKKKMPPLHIKLYVYQLCRALAYIHSQGICHRDIKPQNLLIHPDTQDLKLCDFGSAKILVQSEPNVSYICSRYYRAPELIFGASDYTTAIDIWSSGCVMAELLLTQPIFAGESGIDQLVEIIKVLGTPTRQQITQMSREYGDYKQFPSIKPHPWEKVFPEDTSPVMIDLVSKMLVYPPTERIAPLLACVHPLFDELRTNYDSPTPPLFNFSTDELEQARQAGLLEKLLLKKDSAQKDHPV